MKRWLLAGLVAAGLCAAAAAQSTPGYIVIRVLLDGGGGAVLAAGPGGMAPESGGPGAGPVGPRGRGGPGQPPGGGPGGAGPGAGPGGIGSPDGGGPGGFGGGPGGFGGGQSRVDNRNAVVVAVPFSHIAKTPIYRTSGPSKQNIKTKYGHTFLFEDNVSIQLYYFIGLSYETQIKNLHDKWHKNQSKFDDIYQLTVQALQFGMVDEAFAYAKEMERMIQVQKEKAAPANVVAFAKAFNEVVSFLDSSPAKPNDAEKWKERLGLAAVTESTHYSLVHGREVDPSDINRRLVALEQNFKAFFLWHCLLGTAPKAPESKQIVVLLERSTEMNRFKTGLDGRPVETDAFYSPTYGIVVLSPERLDDVGRTFSKQFQAQLAIGWSREKLLKEAPKVANRTPDEVARMMTLALVDKALEEETDRASISREGSRQLYAATGILPQNVILPEWVENGASSFFERPKGPYIANGGTANTMTVGFAPGYGTTNYILIRQFWELQRSNRLNPNSADLLVKTISDKYFEAALTGEDADPPPLPPLANNSGGGPAAGPGGPRGGQPPRGGPRGGPGPGGPGAGPGGIGEGMPGNPDGGSSPGDNEPNDPATQNLRNKATLEMKAQCTAWALTYFLSRTRIEGLHKFYQELAHMPRDLRLDEKTVTLTFARCFNLLAPDGKSVDQGALKLLADEWVAHMSKAPTTGKDIPINATSGGTGFGPGGPGPGGPGGPGGAGGPGGGGGGRG